jgi:DNA replication protein DnaC
MICPICNGTGWKPVDDHGARRVERCECWRRGVVDKLLAGARIPRRYQHCDLSAFVSYNERLGRALSAARRLADDFPVEQQGLFFLGPPGVGKTHLAVAILKQVIETRGARGLFYDTRDLLKLIRSTYDREVRATEIQVLTPVMEADLLVLDDLGAEKTSEWVDETLNLIVNTRYSERRTTIFTSNYEDREDPVDPDSLLFRIGFRMRSRLHEMCEFVEMDGADYRELPPNGNADDLVMLWKRGRPARRAVGVRSSGQLKASLRDGRGDLKWSGGRAGSKDR